MLNCLALLCQPILSLLASSNRHNSMGCAERLLTERWHGMATRDEGYLELFPSLCICRGNAPNPGLNAGASVLAGSDCTVTCIP